MAQTKETFISKTNFEIDTLKKFKEIWNIVVEIANSYDNKIVNKRFINKVNEKFAENNFSDYRITFITDWRGNRMNLLKVIKFDNYCMESRCYVDSSKLSDTLYGNEDYINKDDFRICAENFRLAVESNNKALDEKIEELTKCVNEIDEVIEKYKAMKLFVETTLNSIPRRLRESIIVPMPIIN